MPFTKYISIVLGILGCYYFIIILFDLLRSGNKPVQVTTHAVQFDKTEKPVVIFDEPGEDVQGENSPPDADAKKYMPREPLVSSRETKRKSPLIDLGLETLSGESYTVDAENLSKFMIA
jgi:hypothetical protein